MWLVVVHVRSIVLLSSSNGAFPLAWTNALHSWDVQIGVTSIVFGKSLGNGALAVTWTDAVDSWWTNNVP